MRIYVENDGRVQLNLHLPNSVLMNRLTALLAPRLMGRETQARPSPRQLHALMQAAKEYRKAHPEWVLVEVLSGDGERVEITL